MHGAVDELFEGIRLGVRPSALLHVLRERADHEEGGDGTWGVEVE